MSARRSAYGGKRRSRAMPAASGTGTRRTSIRKTIRQWRMRASRPPDAQDLAHFILAKRWRRLAFECRRGVEEIRLGLLAQDGQSAPCRAGIFNLHQRCALELEQGSCEADR